MAISKKLRFEVFKRDNFTCQYCGKKSPEVVLETDHIIPLNKGGGDNIENLITSCFDCNRGKGKILLEDYKEGTDPTEQAILLLERERQLSEYNKVLKKIRERKEKDLEIIEEYWGKYYNKIYLPISLVMRALDYTPREKILEAIDICKKTGKKLEEKSWGQSITIYFSWLLKNLTNNYGRGE